ncbi:MULTISPECIES: CsgG/HfaB family protein [Gulbenkiania]|nr:MULTISPECIES: CsgG/HfaB family protein [Gulbenkiania]
MKRLLMMLLATGLVSGCATLDPNKGKPAAVGEDAPVLTPMSSTHKDLLNLPPARGPIVAAVYNFRDQTGQFKPTADSSYSTAVTQGATSMLIKAMLDSGWFVPVEREGLQNLLTERKIIRSTEEKGVAPVELPNLMAAGILLEGGIIGYETNVKTGGGGARYLGIGLSDMYRTDQVTINLRAVDIRSGRILSSISTTKAILSYKLSGDVYKFIKFKSLLELEAGYTRNEPVQLCVQDAIEAGLIYLITKGIKDNHWTLRNNVDLQSPVLQRYLQELVAPAA